MKSHTIKQADNAIIDKPHESIGIVIVYDEARDYCGERGLLDIEISSFGSKAKGLHQCKKKPSRMERFFSN